MVALTAVAMSHGGGPVVESSDDLHDDAGVGIFVPLDEGVVLLEVPGVAAQDIVAQYAADTLFLPYLVLCDFLHIQASVSSDNMILEGLFPAAEPFLISRTDRVARRGAVSIPFLDADVRLVGGEIYIRHTLLFSLLNLTARFDLSRLTLTVGADERLPVVQWSRRRGRSSMAWADDGSPFSLLESASPHRRLLGAPIIDWTLTHSIYSGRNIGSGNLTLGGGVLFGELELGVSGGTVRTTHGTPGVTLDRWNWSYYAPEFPLMRRAVLGTISAAGTYGYGLELSNVPLATRSFVGEHDIRGQTRPGWTVELYNGVRVMDVVQADSLGYYHFDVPVGYGLVDRTLKFIGPYGEVITEAVRVQLSSGILPAGEVQYTMRGSSARFAETSPFGAEGRIGFGVTRRLTLAAEAEMRGAALREPVSDSIAMRASATAWLGSSSTVTLHYGLRSELVGGEFYTISPENVVVRGGIDSMTLDARSFRGRLEGTVPMGGISFSGAGVLERRNGWYKMGLLPRISGYLGGLNFIASADVAWLQDSSRAQSEPPRRVEVRSGAQVIATPFVGTLLKGEGVYNHVRQKLERLDLYGYARINKYVALGLGYSVPDLDWKRGLLRAQLELQFSPARLFFAVGREQGITSVSTMARGSALVSAAGVTPLSEYAVGMSAIMVRAFRDDNGNGVRDAGEEDLPAPRASLIMGAMRMQSPDGVFTSLTPNMEWHIEVDRWEHAAEGLYPGRLLHRLYLLPSSVATVDVPYRPGMDVTGKCMVEEKRPDGATRTVASSSVNGLRVLLVSEASGAYYDGETFSDGTILIAGVAQGRYRLRFDSAQLVARRLAVSAAAEDEIVLDGTSDRLPPVTLTRLP